MVRRKTRPVRLSPPVEAMSGRPRGEAIRIGLLVLVTAAQVVVTIWLIGDLLQVL